MVSANEFTQCDTTTRVIQLPSVNESLASSSSQCQWVASVTQRPVSFELSNVIKLPVSMSHESQPIISVIKLPVSMRHQRQRLYPMSNNYHCHPITNVTDFNIIYRNILLLYTSLAQKFERECWDWCEQCWEQRCWGVWLWEQISKHM